MANFALMEKKTAQLNIKNKKAFFEYEILDKYVAGLQLQGTEIKSVRAGKANIKEAFCFFKADELWVKNMHISEYSHATYFNHDPLRERKLLLNRQELKKLSEKLKNQGLTIVPLKLFINGKGWAKLEIGLAKGKKLYDKRDSLKQKDMKRQVDRSLSER